MLEFLDSILVLPTDCLDYISTFLSNKDIYTLSILSKGNSLEFDDMMCNRRISLNKEYSLLYIQDDYFKNKIKTRKLQLNLTRVLKETDLNKFLNLKMVYSIVLNKNNITGIKMFSRRRENLHRLYLKSNHVQNISPISALINLNVLHLCHNIISDISPISKLKNLKCLCIHNNEIVDISPLSTLKRLFGLDLSYNRIIDISPLSNLVNLHNLNLKNNKIIDVTPLSNLDKLENLNLKNNNTLDLLSVLKITNLLKTQVEI